MTEEIIIAGFGGQGVILSGKLLCVAAMREGKKVSHIPSYGAEMRGGTANCSIIISDEEVASPVVEHPSACVVLNTPSLVKFEPKIRAGGLLIYNKSLITVQPKRTDITVIGIEANAISAALGSLKAANMAAIGLLLKLKPILASVESVKKALNEVISERNKKFNPLNISIIEAGYAV
jgi:2-oxoglutarate ferredoxin oxidoreductase subunit gamma